VSNERVGVVEMFNLIIFASHATDTEEIAERFDFVHNRMNVSHDKIIQSPELLTTRRQRLRERHGFLKSLGKAQYDETKPGFVPFMDLVAGTDQAFVLNVCKSSLESYDNFLKTL
jgi:mTERF domain-containing protein, mitochondrial